MTVRSAALANEFISRAAEHGRHFTQMQLQKLVYIAHGWNLAIHGEPLTSDDPAAWPYGPVYIELLCALRRYGKTPVEKKITLSDLPEWGFIEEDHDRDVAAELADKEKVLTDRVFEVYGQYHAFQLSALTHQKGTPWDTVYNKLGGEREPIGKELIKKHFEGLRASAAPADA